MVPDLGTGERGLPWDIGGLGAGLAGARGWCMEEGKGVPPAAKMTGDASAAGSLGIKF